MPGDRTAGGGLAANVDLRRSRRAPAAGLLQLRHAGAGGRQLTGAADPERVTADAPAAAGHGRNPLANDRPDAVGGERRATAVAAAQHPAEQRSGGVAGCLQVAVDRGARRRPDVAGGSLPELVGLAGCDMDAAASVGGVRFQVPALQRRYLADAGQGIAQDQDDRRIAQALETATAVAGKSSRRFRLRPADAGDLAAAARCRPSRPMRCSTSRHRLSAVGSASPEAWCTLAMDARATRMVAGAAPPAWRASR